VVIELELGGWLHARYTSLHSFVSVGDLLAGALQIVMCNATNVSVKGWCFEIQCVFVSCY
jgi:hypothetical protein